MASPFRWLWNQARQLYQRFRGENLDRTVAPTPELRDEFIAAGQGWIAETTSGLMSGDASIQQWVLDMRGRLKDTYINEYMLSRGGREMMTQQDWGSIGGQLRNQYQYLNRFADDIASGKLSEKQINQRAQMYFDSARQAHERGKVAARGMPALPAYPGDGSTQCMTNCQCHWEIEETEDEWLATWTLGMAEHCPDCMQRASDWAPLRFPK